MLHVLVLLSLAVREYANAILALVPLRKSLRFPTNITAAIYIGVTCLEALLYLKNGSQFFIRDIYLMGILHMILPFFVCNALPSKIIFCTMFMSFCSMPLFSLAYSLAALLFPHLPLTAAFSLVAALETLILFYPLFKLVKSFAPTLNDSRNAKVIILTDWILFLALFGLIFIRNFNLGALWHLTISRLFGSLGALLCIYITLQLLKQQQTNAQIDMQLSALQELRISEKRYFEHVIDNWQSSRRLRYDLNKQAVVLRASLQQADYPKLKAQLETFLHNTEKLRRVNLCGHRVIDAVTGYWQLQAWEENISFQADLQVNDVKIDNIDLAILLGNALENAFTAAKACADNPSIMLKLTTKGGLLLLKLQNTYQEKLVQENGTYLSSKRGFAEPGKGLANMQLVVDKYNGYLQLEPKSGLFTVNIALNNEEVQHD